MTMPKAPNVALPTININEIDVSFLPLSLSPLSSLPLSSPLLLHPTKIFYCPLGQWGTGCFPLEMASLVSWFTFFPMPGATLCFLPAGGILWCCRGLQEVSKPEGREGRRNHRQLKSRESRVLTVQPCPLQSPALRPALQRPSVHPLPRHHYSCHRNPSHKVRPSRAPSTTRGRPLGSHTHHAVAGDLLPCLPSPPLPLHARLPSSHPGGRAVLLALLSGPNLDVGPASSPCPGPAQPAQPVTSLLPHGTNLTLPLPLPWIFLLRL